MSSLRTQFVKIGTILKPVGTSGELKVEIGDEFIEDFVASPSYFRQDKWRLCTILY
ncbi:MAG: hypothetical protein IPN46_10745 [Saprospiraceae bacterium]|nr:hypothetical protein [Saprospiraceae bacterium]